MIITCNKCSTRFNLDDSLVKEGGSKCRCAVCKHIFTAFPLPPEPEQTDLLPPDPPQPDASQTELWATPSWKPAFEDADEPEPTEPDADAEPAGSEVESEPEPEPEAEVWEMEQEPEQTTEFNFESDPDDDDFFKDSSDVEMEELEFSSKASALEMENPYQDLTENELEIDDDFSFEEEPFDIEEDLPPSDESGVQTDYQEFEADLISFDEQDPAADEAPPMEEDPSSEALPVLEEEPDLEWPPSLEEKSPVAEADTLEAQDSLSIETDEPENLNPVLSPDLEMDNTAEPAISPEKEGFEDDDDIKKTVETEPDLMEDERETIDPPPKKEKKVVVKSFAEATSKSAVKAKPKPKKEKKKSAVRLPVLILLLLLLLGIGGYLAIVMTGYKLPAIDQYIKKPIPETSEAKPIPNQKSVNGRFVTNSTAGTLFVITGRVENPSNIAYSHIEIRGALITKNKEEAKIKNAFCGNIITEEMLKSGNISDINALLALKEGAHKINVNVAPGASVPFMVVFSDLPEKLENFTIKIAGFDKVVN